MRKYNLVVLLRDSLLPNAEGILPAPEAKHAVKAAIDQALYCKAEGTSKTILFNLCGHGHGHFDMQAYRYTEYNAEEVEIALARLSVFD